MVPGVQETDLADQVGSPDQGVGTIQEEHRMEGSLDQEDHSQEDRNVVDRREDNRSLGREVVEGSREVDQVDYLEDQGDQEGLEEEVAVGELEGQGGACSIHSLAVNNLVGRNKKQDNISEGRQRKYPHGFALSEQVCVYIRNTSSLKRAGRN